MAHKIEVYIRNDKVPVPQEFVRSVVDHPCLDRQVSKIERVMPQSDELALKCAREFADSKGISIEVCDINTFGGRIKAWMKGVSTSPTIIVGDSRVQGEFTEEQLRSKLQSCITQ